jgi:hypothetical protein
MLDLIRCCFMASIPSLHLYLIGPGNGVAHSLSHRGQESITMSNKLVFLVAALALAKVSERTSRQVSFLLHLMYGLDTFRTDIL